MPGKVRDDLFDDELEPQGAVVVDGEGNEQPQRKRDEEPPDDEDESEGGETDRRAGGGGDDEGDAGDEDEDERERIRERRREERKHRKERQRERETTFVRELAARDSVIRDLQQRLDQIDRRAVGFDLANIDQQLSQLNQAYLGERDRVTKSIEEQDGASASQATENMMRLRDRFNELQRIKQAYSQNQNRPPPLDPRLVQYASQWQSENGWYRTDGTDMDSRIVRLIDDSMAQEGWQPTTREYWEELTSRVRKQLPHRYSRGGGDDDQEGRGDRGRDNGGGENFGRVNVRTGSPVGGSSHSSGPGKNNGGGYTISAERVAAMKEAGVWDNPERRKRAIEHYRQYDREHANERGV